MNDEIPLEAPPVDDDEQGVDVNKLPQGPRPGVKPGRNLAPSAGGGGGGGGGAPKPTAKPARPSPGAASKQPTGNMPPVGDIQLKKKSGTYNTYTIQLSYGQIEAIRNALESDHANPIGDELKALFDYYINSIPGPGEEEEDVKAREEQAAIAGGHATAASQDDADAAIPMPPGDDNGGQITTAGEGPDDMGGGGAGGLHMPAGEDDEEQLPEPPAPQHMPDFGEPSADAHLPSPPRE